MRFYDALLNGLKEQKFSFRPSSAKNFKERLPPPPIVDLARLEIWVVESEDFLLTVELFLTTDP